MSEKKIWLVVVLAMAFTGAVLVLVALDTSFLSGYYGGNIIPVAVGDHAELVTIRNSPLQGFSETGIYRLDADGTLTELQKLKEQAHCVTGFDGKLFITFSDYSSSVYEGGKWIRGVSPPEFSIADVAPLDGELCAFGTEIDLTRPDSPQTTISVAVLGDNGWDTPAAPLVLSEELRFRGCTGCDAGVALILAKGITEYGLPDDLDSIGWRLVVFDGASWGDVQEITPPSQSFPMLSEYNGSIAFLVKEAGEGKPIRLALLDGVEMKEFASLDIPEEKTLISAWLTRVGESYHVIASCSDSVWDLPIVDGVPGEARAFEKLGTPTKAGSAIYSALLFVGALMMVSFGIAWLAVRLVAMRRRSEE